MQGDKEQILRCILRELSSIDAADLASREARATVATARSLLAWLLVSDLELPVLRRDQRNRLQSQFAALGLAAEPSGPSSADPAEHAATLVSDLICKPHAAASARLGARDLVQSLISPHELAQSSVDAIATQAGAGLGTKPRLNVEQINAYLADRPSGAPTRRIKNVQYIPGGFSRETILLATDDPSEAGDIVLRKVVDGRRRGCLFEEWQVLSFAWGLGLPVPKPLWLEAEPGKLGNVFFAVSRVRGANCGDVFGKQGRVDADVALQLARFLAALHQADASALGQLPVLPMCTHDEIDQAIDQLARPAGTASGADDPIYDVLRDWLRANIPRPPPRCALLHGDVGFHNLLVDGSRITGILDWERAHLGDPAEELAYVRSAVESVVPWETFLDEYCRAGGSAPSAEALGFYTVWQGVWRAAACLDLRREFLSEENPRLHDALPAFIYAPRFIAAAARAAFDLPPGS